MAELAVDWTVGPHGAVFDGDKIIAYMPENTSIGFHLAKMIQAEHLNVGRVLTTDEVTALFMEQED